MDIRLRALPRSIVIVMLLASGCAAFEGNNLPKVDVATRVAPQGGERPNAAVSFAAVIDYGSKKDNTGAARDLMQQEFINELVASGYFGLVGSGDDAPVKFTVQVTDKGNPAALIPAFITGLSLYTIPSWATGTYTANVTVNAPGKQPRSYALSDTVTLVQWLPMIFAAPVKGIVKVPTEMRRNMWRNLIVQMETDGTLPVGPAAPASGGAE